MCSGEQLVHHVEHQQRLHAVIESAPERWSRPAEADGVAEEGAVAPFGDRLADVGHGEPRLAKMRAHLSGGRDDCEGRAPRNCA